MPLMNNEAGGSSTSPPKQESFNPQTLVANLESHKKKRSKLIRIGTSGTTSSSFSDHHYQANIPKPISARKPDPNAPKITPPCTECGRRFWSLKALFGHMRCHPEREWRGINPPPNLQRQENWSLVPGTRFTEEDHQVAESLVMLASGATTTGTSNAAACSSANLLGSNGGRIEVARDPVAWEALGLGEFDVAGPPSSNCGFECSSCKKVFGSHQALGGHRASHKNVKGCFAIARNEFEGHEPGQICGHSHEDGGNGGEGKWVIKENFMELGNHHQCSICLRVFSSGQALGGHKRCHWEKGEDHESSPLSPSQGLMLMNNYSFTSKNQEWGWDLNLPAPVENDGGDSSSSSSSSDLGLDLSLGI